MKVLIEASPEFLQGLRNAVEVKQPIAGAVKAMSVLEGDQAKWATGSAPVGAFVLALSDEDLVLEVGRQPAGRIASAAIRELYERFRPRMLHHFRRRGASDSDAEDLLAETFVRIWRGARFYGPSQGSARAWLFKSVALAESQHYYQRRGVRLVELPNTAHEEAAALQEPASGSFAPESPLEDAEMLAAFTSSWDRFEQAHPDAANVLRWVVVEGMDTAEIAALTNRTNGAARELISQSRRKAQPFFRDARSLHGLTGDAG